MSISNISFCVTKAATNGSNKYGPRLGVVSQEISETTTIETPGILVSTSRGVVSHLSRDNVRKTAAIRWLNVPFETFCGLHRCITSSDWCEYVAECKPDVVVALSDTPFTAPPFSQKRMEKSIERSRVYLSHMLSTKYHRPNVLVQMAGGANPAARTAFARSLLEPVAGKEAEEVKPLKCLDEGVTGYVFDLVPLRTALGADPSLGVSSDEQQQALVQKYSAASSSYLPGQLTSLLRASLQPLPATKLRLVNTPRSPHEILYLIRDVGIDLFDTHWAQRAADVGVALDFTFPVPHDLDVPQRPLGHDLYDATYAHDFGKLADCFATGDSIATGAADTQSMVVCPCVACSPTSAATRIRHSEIDEPESHPVELCSPFSRAYIHHLLHTHEMSAHALLAMHNITVMDLFSAGIRSVLRREDCEDAFAAEIARFDAVYVDDARLLEEARTHWQDVDLTRGKGRLAREKTKQEQNAAVSAH
ncbi:tRNA-guanine transglycosylase [Fistulina hepatica ATCC 64428]|uniref:tRNA-guanine transglycosylase n=1 Tax=Fistulina hepatica ATCC 64428 TaxID=1128425 RepID=A0A0D7A5Y2_9AGAR|nr:tRNA-guanine transglycosylase [Fistulina hepatica ATCC 64428]